MVDYKTSVSGKVPSYGTASTTKGPDYKFKMTASDLKALQLAFDEKLANIVGKETVASKRDEFFEASYTVAARMVDEAGSATTRESYAVEIANAMGVDDAFLAYQKQLNLSTEISR